MRDAHMAWGSILQDRANAAAVIHYGAQNVLQNYDRLGAMQAYSELQRLQDQAKAIPTSFGSSALRDISDVQQAIQAGNYGTPQEQILRALNAKSGNVVGAALSSTTPEGWGLLTGATDASAWWKQSTDTWNAAHPQTPVATPATAEVAAPWALSPFEDALMDASADWGSIQPNQYFATQMPWEAPSPDGTLALKSTGREVAETALSQRGKPYVWGAEDPRHGFDCSGLVQWAWAQHGVKLPRTTWQQITVGRAVDVKDMQPGDAIFFDMNHGQRDANHVGIYIGNGKMVAAPKPGDVVKTYTVAGYWSSKVVGVRRYG